MVRSVILVKRWIILFALSVCLGFAPLPALAQNQAQGSVTTYTPRQQLATIIFSGLAGAILGLSTLSFYGRPQDKLSNIAVGFAIGIIGGTVYTTFQAATRPTMHYGAQYLGPMTQRQMADQMQAHTSPPPTIQWQWEFD